VRRDGHGSLLQRELSALVGSAGRPRRAHKAMTIDLSGRLQSDRTTSTRHFISVGFPRLGTLAKTSCRTRTASAARPAISRIRTGTSTGSAAGWRRTSLWEHVIPTIRLSAYVWADLQAGQRSIDRRHHICSQGSLCQGTGVFLDLGNCTEAGNWQRAGRTRP